MSRFVALLVDGVVEIHAADAFGGTYATLCSLDGDDPGSNQFAAQLPDKPKIDCKQCIAIIDVAKTYKERELQRSQP